MSIARWTRTRTWTLAVPAILTFLAVCAGPLAAQSDPSGLQLGIHLNASAIKYEDVDEYGSDDLEKGGGLGFGAGYGFNETFGIFLNFDVASMNPGDESYALGHGDLGLRATYGEYTTVSLGGESEDLDEGLKATSSRIDFGIMWFVGG